MPKLIGLGGTTDLLFVMTMSICGPGNYRLLFGECGSCSFHTVFDFLNSTFEFDRFRHDS